MTREEAINLLDNLKGMIEDNQNNDYDAALNMAIKALEQEPCEDCIDRSKLGLTDFEIIMCDGDYKEALKMLLDKIEKAPSVYPTASFINKPCISEGVCHDIAVQKMIECEDAISRQAVEDAIANTIVNGESLGYAVAWDILSDLPPVTPKPKTGHWIEYTRVLAPEPINRWEQAWYCSECGYGNQECDDGSAWLEWKYCPRCGAKMESEDKE